MSAVTQPAPAEEAGAELPAAPPHLSAGSRLAEALDRSVFTISVLAVLCLIQAVIVRASVIADSWYTLLSGRLIVHSGLPDTDTLTVLAAGRRWVDQQWLAHLGLYGVWNAGGWRLAGPVVILLYAGAFAVAAGSSRRFGASDRSTALVLAVCFLAGLPNSGFRAQLPAYVLFALTFMLLLDDARAPTRRTYLVFPLLVLWANVHGSVILGAGFVALRGLTVAVSSLRARQAWRSWAPRAASLVLLPWLCTLVSPYALHLPGYYRSFLDNPTLAHSLVEWGSSTLRGQPVFFALLLAGLWLGTRSRAALTGFAELALWAAAVLGLAAVRNQIWFALAAAAILPAALDALWKPSTVPRKARLNQALALVAILFAAALIGRDALRGAGWYEKDFPARAAAAVTAAHRSDPSLRVFADERYADWLLFRDPTLAGRVAYDARLELLTPERLRSVVAFRTEEGLDWQRAAAGYGVLVLDPQDDRAAIRWFARQPGTRVLFRDGHVVVLRR